MPRDAKIARAKVLANKAAMDSEYTYSDRWQPADISNPLSIHSTAELIEAAKTGKVEVEARLLSYAKKTESGKSVAKRGYRCLDTKGFVEAATLKRDSKQLKEALDLFALDLERVSGGGAVGQDFIPLLGGPFNKQLYYYDYMRMHALAFNAYHHDPLARATVQITRDFTLGRGFRVDCKSDKHLAVWRAFEDVNNLQMLVRQIAEELSIYGEVMPWFLPNRDTKIAFMVRPGQEPPKGLLPRVRLIDPSCIWDIITYPEDITRVLAYQWVAPTQYQTYTAKDGGSQVPGTKFIYQQIPAAEVLHYRINCVSNEKRGRSDLFPALGYMKRLRDSVQYAVLSMQKQAAWSIDTTIDGSAADIDAYVAAIAQQASIAAAGSEFVHNKQVSRQFLANVAGKAGGSDAFDWCLSMIAAGVGIPVQYYGTHLSGAGTRASALVATEPVAKKFEVRQGDYEAILKMISRKLWDAMGMEQVDIEVTFPELIVQDRSAKVKDLAAGQAAGWISKKRAAEIFAKEMGITEYEYEAELADIAKERGPEANPLTATGSSISKIAADLAGQGSSSGAGQPSGVSSEMRAQVAKNDG